VQHRDGTTETKYAPMKKTVYSLPALAEQLRAANRRYLEFLSALATPEVGVQRLNRVTETRVEKEHRYKGFNLLAEADAAVLRLLLRGEFAISGLTARAIRKLLSDKTRGQISRLLKRLRVHGLLRKIGHHYKYYLTDLGREVATMTLKLRELYVIPALTY
jgi:DNA-binding transcriptional ArsR family regulator